MDRNVINKNSLLKETPQFSSENSGVQLRQYAGMHLLAEFWDAKHIEELSVLDNVLRCASEASNSKALKVEICKFSPYGVTGFVILAESHISIHSWPEMNYLAIDIFTCGEHTMPHNALEYLKQIFCPQKIEIQEIKRGKL